MHNAIEIMTNEMGYHTPVAFSPDLKEAIWRPMEKDGGSVLYSKQVNGIWPSPKEINFGLEMGALDPIFAFDGQKIFSLSFQSDKSGGVERERIC